MLNPFKENKQLTLGVELELQLVDLQNFNLAMEASDFLARLSKLINTGEIKPEITLAMIELNTSVHTTYTSLLHELHDIKKIAAEEAARRHIGICGGGTHPFQKWQEQRIYPNQRFTSLSEQYGYLAKQFTVFGQHIHIGCPTGDDAIYLCHAFSRYLPHFIALSAASPFHHGVDTNFDCSRLSILGAFPLSGTPPWLLSWSEFEAYYHKMHDLGIAKSMKDFYWDIRPKPEYGTVEIRICDTPLTVDKAAALAGYAQTLACWLLDNKPEINRDMYLTYSYNRFNASRYGLNAIYIDHIQGTQIPLVVDILNVCEQLRPYSPALGTEDAIEQLKTYLYNKENDAIWLREQHDNHHSLADMVRHQVMRWCE